MDFLFGLDNLKRHRCSIDLAQNALVVRVPSAVRIAGPSPPPAPPADIHIALLSSQLFDIHAALLLSSQFTEIDTKLPFLAEHELPSNAFGRAKTEGGPGNAPDAAGAGTSGAGAGKEAAEGPSKGQGSGKDGGDRNTREGEKGGGLGVGGGGTASGEGREKEGAAGAGSSGGVDRSKIAELMGLGFPEAICIQALESCNGDVEAAASMLFSLQE